MITGGAFILSVFLWFFSSLRFQAEMGIMMGLWLWASAWSALFIVPSMVYVFRPDFIVGNGRVQAVNEKAAAESLIGGAPEFQKSN